MRIIPQTRLLRSPWGISTILYVAVAVTAQYLPLANDLHYEFAALVAIAASLVAGLTVIARMPRFVRGSAPVDAPLRSGADIAIACLLSMIPLGVALIASLFRMNCGLGEGIAWYLTLVPASALVSGVIGACGATMARRRWLAALLFLALWCGSMARGAYEALAGPHIFLYSWQVGFFPGGSWDAELPIPALLLGYRAVHLAAAGGLLFVLGQIRILRSGSIDGRNIPAVWVIAAGTALAMALVGMRSEIGLTRSTEWLRSELGDSLRTRMATIYYNAPTTDSLDLWRAANLTDFYLTEHARVLGIPQDRVERVCIYLYASPAEEKRMVGTASAAFTKPWARSVNMTFGDVGSTLRHELAHVMMARYGNPLGISISQGMLEGSAVALENSFGWHTLHEYAAAMYRLKMAPPVEEIMSIGGFSLHRASMSYVLAGSFSQWLIATYGVDRYCSAFAWGSFESAYGRSLHELSEQYGAFIRAYSSSVDAATMRHLFGGGSFFLQKCLRRIGTLNARGYEAMAEERYGRALEQFAASLAEGINYTARIGVIRSLAALGRYQVLLDSFTEYSHDTASYPLLPYLIEQGDAWWARGDTANAARLYDSVLRLQINAPTSLRAASRLYFIDAGDSLRDVMRTYFTRLMPVAQRIILLDQALALATPRQRSILALMRATLTVNRAPLTSLMLAAPMFQMPRDSARASEREDAVGPRSTLWADLTDAYAVRLCDAGIFASRCRECGQAGSELANFITFIGERFSSPRFTGIGLLPASRADDRYALDRMREQRAFLEYLSHNEIRP
ncbi:MAG TPA: hypothetical protein VHI13_19585 [Candidatus Kapabacteria bacterium]|nr:hypothetical protein [Candidatus Kapabacteria bacterium]